MGIVRQELVDEIIRQHLTPGKEELLSASQAARCASSSFAFYCDLFAPEEQRDPDSGILALRRARGLAYEQEVIEFPTEEIPYIGLEEGFRRTVELMAAGEQVIVQGVLFSKSEGLVGKPDQLMRVDGLDSIFGNYQYRILEIKSHFNLTEHDKIQTAFYTLLLGYIQGATPDTFEILTGQKKQVHESSSHWEWEATRVIEDARLIILKRYTPTPIFGGTPNPWRTYGDKVAKSDITSLSQIGGPRRTTLTTAGYMSIADIAGANVDDLLKVPLIDSYVAPRIISQAQARIANVPIFKHPINLPAANTEIFLDMENINEGLDYLYGTKTGFFNYLIGVVVRSNGEEIYTPFFAEEIALSAEEECWRAFCGLIASLESPAIYYYAASAEPVYLRKLIEKYDIPDSVKITLDKKIDLNRRLTDAVAFPCPDYGLKTIGNYLGFEFCLPEWDGLIAMVEYKNYVRTKSPNLREEILEYNADDCRALMHIKDWLVENSPRSTV